MQFALFSVDFFHQGQDTLFIRDIGYRTGSVIPLRKLRYVKKSELTESTIPRCHVGSALLALIPPSYAPWCILGHRYSPGHVQSVFEILQSARKPPMYLTIKPIPLPPPVTKAVNPEMSKSWEAWRFAIIDAVYCLKGKLVSLDTWMEPAASSFCM